MLVALIHVWLLQNKSIKFLLNMFIYIIGFRRANRNFRGQGSRPHKRALVNEGEPKNGGSGATSPGNVFGPRPLDWL